MQIKEIEVDEDHLYILISCRLKIAFVGTIKKIEDQIDIQNIISITSDNKISLQQDFRKDKAFESNEYFLYSIYNVRLEIIKSFI